MSNIFRKFRTVAKPPEKPKSSMAIDTNSTFVYTGGADVQKIWRKHGWTPPSEYRNDYLFKKNREIEHE
jgi:hypothetical protein